MSDLLLEAQLELSIHDIGQRHAYADILCERGDLAVEIDFVDFAFVEPEDLSWGQE